MSLHADVVGHRCVNSLHNMVLAVCEFWTISEPIAQPHPPGILAFFFAFEISSLRRRSFLYSNKIIFVYFENSLWLPFFPRQEEKVINCNQYATKIKLFILSLQFLDLSFFLYLFLSLFLKPCEIHFLEGSKLEVDYSDFTFWHLLK